MSLFDTCVDYSKDVFRNIRGINISQDLFDDLSEDPKNWEAANNLEIYTHPPLKYPSLIQRPFDYSQNEFIDYPFENITASRFSDGSFGCWYGCELFETSIVETKCHFERELLDTPEAFQDQAEVKIDRRVAKVHCHAVALDLSRKAKEFAWLVDKNNYKKCHEIGARVFKEGHPLLRAPSARQKGGINLVAFNPAVLSNPRDYCYLQYIYTVPSQKITVYRNNKMINS